MKNNLTEIGIRDEETLAQDRDREIWASMAFENPRKKK